MNRIQDGIDKMATKLADMNGVDMKGRPLSEMDETTALASDEFVAFQNAQSRAFASGLLTLEESQTLYMGLGGEMRSSSNHGWPKNTNLAAKIVITQACAELMGVTA